MASADAVYGAIAGCGITAVSTLLLDYQTVLRLSGGVFLVALGGRAFRAEPAATDGATGSVQGLALSAGVSRFRARVTRTVMRRVSRLAGAVIVGFGLVALWGVR